MFFVSQAWAREATDAMATVAADTMVEEPSTLMTIAPVIVVFIIFYVLFIMPQNKRIREHQAAIKAMKKGDKVVTGGGIVGTISKIINDEEMEIEIADKTVIKVLRHTIVGEYKPGITKK